MADMLAITWTDPGPAEGTTDLIPRYWFGKEGKCEFRQHVVTYKEGGWAKVRCSVSVQGNIVIIDFCGDHAASNLENDFELGCARLRFEDEERRGIPIIGWKYEGDAEFSEDWNYEIEDRRAAPPQEAEPFNPKNKDDGRKKIERLVAVRQGQSRFRDDLLRAYGGSCAITGCTIEEVLQAAHIMPHRGRHTNVVENGLLLRADIHTLFDLDILRIDKDYRIHVPESLRVQLGLPGEIANLPLEQTDHPSPEALAERWADAAAA